MPKAVDWGCKVCIVIRLCCLAITCCHSMCPQKILTVFMFSFFLGELEKCLEDPEKLGSLFVKHVSANVFFGQPLLLLLSNVFIKDLWYNMVT